MLLGWWRRQQLADGWLHLDVPDLNGSRVKNEPAEVAPDVVFDYSVFASNPVKSLKSREANGQKRCVYGQNNKTK